MRYHNHAALTSDLEAIRKMSPQHASLFTLGKSIMEQELLGVRLKNEAIEDDLRPMVKLVGNMHGNEPTGRELIIHLAKYIVMAAALEAYNSTAVDETMRRAANLLKTTDLWLLPTMNPDG
jgi:hypothetical protein